MPRCRLPATLFTISLPRKTATSTLKISEPSFVVASNATESRPSTAKLSKSKKPQPLPLAAESAVLLAAQSRQENTPLLRHPDGGVFLDGFPSPLTPSPMVVRGRAYERASMLMSGEMGTVKENKDAASGRNRADTSASRRTSPSVSRPRASTTTSSNSLRAPSLTRSASATSSISALSANTVHSAGSTTSSPAFASSRSSTSINPSRYTSTLRGPMPAPMSIPKRARGGALWQRSGKTSKRKVAEQGKNTQGRFLVVLGSGEGVGSIVVKASG